MSEKTEDENNTELSPELKKARRRHLTERLEALRDRANMIEIELRNYTSDYFRVCIFGSARIKQHDDHYKLTERLAYLLGADGIDVLTGGGPGLMEAANKGARAGRQASGSSSRSFGVTIDLGKFEQPSEHLDIKHHHRRFSSRLDDFMRLSNAIVVTPGGIGTALELFFTWQLLQVGHMSERPIVLFNQSFWEGLIAWMKETLLKNGLISAGDFRWIHYANTPEEAHAIIKVEHQKFLEREVAKGLASE